MTLKILNEASESKVCNLGVEVPVQEDVAGLDVAMYDTHLRLFMQVCQPSCNPKGNAEPCRPVEMYLHVA